MSEPEVKPEPQPQAQLAAVEKKVEAKPAQNVELKLTEDSPDAIDSGIRKEASDYANGALARLVKFGQDSGIKVS